MKTFRLITAAFFVAAIFAVSAFAQAAQQPAAPGKIVYINVDAFAGDEKNVGGIPSYITAMTTLEDEFKPVNNDLQALGVKYQAWGTEIQNLQKTASNPNVPAATSATLQSKIEQYQQMERDIKFKQEDAKAKYQARYNTIVGPVMQDILKSLQDFAKQRNYSMILDAAKLDEAGIILAVGNDSADVTKDFIAYYNSRPAGTATTATPK
ncbi:MAG: OmpH family outer membrane protein [Pyrinomonadaceae bacterium]